MARTLFFLLATTVLASTAWAEPTFLAKQYTRCTACHYSPTGGGLLTPYGRLLSHRELSTAGGAATAPEAGAEDDPHGEQAFLYGALGDALGPVHLGLEMRPSHLRVGFPGGHQDMNLQMNLDLVGAVQKNGWTAYGTAGREPPNPPCGTAARCPIRAFISYEHWISYQTDEGFRIRAGRFLPAYGVRFADHTTYTREDLDLDRNDQVYGFEVSGTIGPFVGPGDGQPRQGRGHPARPQSSRVVHRRPLAVRSRAARDHRRLGLLSSFDGCRIRESGAVGAAFGFAPTSRVSIWTEVDANLQTKAAGGRSWVVVNETSVEVYRGIWLKFSPQLRTSGGAPGDQVCAASGLQRTCCCARTGT